MPLLNPRYLVAGRGGLVGSHLLALAAAATTARAAGEEDNDGGSQGEDSSDKDEPDTDSPLSVEVDVCIVDPSLDNGEASKVAGQGDNSDKEGQEGDKRRHQGAQCAGAEGQEEGDEAEPGSNGVQHHDISQCLGRVLGSIRKFNDIASSSVVNDRGRVVADLRLGAFIAALSENAVTKGAKVDYRWGLASVGPGQLVKVDLKDGDVVDYRSSDVNDDEQDCRCEQQEAAEMVDESSNAHCDVVYSAV